MSNIISLGRVDTFVMAKRLGMAHDGAAVLAKLFQGKQVELIKETFFCTMDTTTWQRTASATLPIGEKVTVLSVSNGGFRGLEAHCQAENGMTQVVSVDSLGFRR